jgi:hypothetical protein
MINRAVIQRSKLSKISKHYLTENTRIVMKRGQTIERLMTNHYKTARRYHLIECAGYPWCKEDEHFGSLMSEMEGEIGVVGRLASNTVVWDDRRIRGTMY